MKYCIKNLLLLFILSLFSCYNDPPASVAKGSNSQEAPSPPPPASVAKFRLALDKLTSGSFRGSEDIANVFTLVANGADPQTIAEAFRTVSNTVFRTDPFRHAADAFKLVVNGANSQTIAAKCKEAADAFRTAAMDTFPEPTQVEKAFYTAAADAFDAKADELK